MRNLTNAEKENGELAIRMLSEKAQKAYSGADPLEVYEVDGTYYVRGAFGDHDGLALEELDELLSDLYLPTFWTADREAGNKIESFDSREEAEQAILEYEEADKQDETYEPDFYSIIEE